MKPRAVVILNEAARHGTAVQRFARVADLLHDRFDLRVLRTDPQGLWRAALEDEVRAAAAVVLAAGGDGTVGDVASALLACPGSDAIAFGAVGLGSSNDFHKPFGLVHSGVPLRIDHGSAHPRDVGRALFSRNGESPTERTFLVSASLGVTARANAIFNRGSGAGLGFLKRHSVQGAIFYAALASLLRHANVAARLRMDDAEGQFAMSNLSVLKTPFLSGCLRYDTEVAPDSGLLAVNLCHGMNRRALVGILSQLARGRFAGRPQTRGWIVSRVEVDLEEPAALELDGEVVTARHVAFDVLPRRILACA
jgi:diacylglycerol kinase (ATP)